MARINPKLTPSAAALEAAAEIAANGGTLTAEEWEFTQQYMTVGSSYSRSRALAMAGKDGAIVGSAGFWRIYQRRRPPV